jgi:hypothetical protein
MNQRGAVSIDRVVDAIRFEIAEGDIFGQGGKLNQNHAMVWPRVNWAIDGQSVGQTLMTNQEEL